MRKLWLGVACCGLAGSALLSGCSSNDEGANSARRLPPDVKMEEIQRRQTMTPTPAAKEEEAAAGRRPPDVKR